MTTMYDSVRIHRPTGRSEIPGRTCRAQQPGFFLGKSAGTGIYRDDLQDWTWRRLLQYSAFFYLGEIACTIPGVDRYKLVFLLALCSETAPALVTLNKEILVLFSTFMFAKYIYSERRSWLLLGFVLLVSLFARWEQIALILLYLFLQRKGSVFKRNPRFSIGIVIGVLTVAYGLIAKLPGSGLGAFTQYTKNANTIAKLDTIQEHFGFPLVLAPKILMNLMGELLRPMTFVREYSLLGFGDIHSLFIIPLFSIALITLLILAYRQGKLNPAAAHRFPDPYLRHSDRDNALCSAAL